MLSYRHALHAGSVHDVCKHVVLCALLEAVTRKETPFLYLDTHAGAGMHDLDAATGAGHAEHADGIARLWPRRGTPMPAIVARYLDIVAGCNRGGALRFYPGSSRIAGAFLRPQDRALCAELDAGVAQALGRNLKHLANADRVRGDGYALLRASLPAREHRALVLVDPAYERADEPQRVVDAVHDGLRRMGHGVFAVWYPIGGKADARRLVERLRALAPDRTLVAMLARAQPPGDGRARGSGLCIFNAPFRADAVVSGALSWLASALAPPAYVAG